MTTKHKTSIADDMEAARTMAERSKTLPLFVRDKQTGLILCDCGHGVTRDHTAPAAGEDGRLPLTREPYWGPCNASGCDCSGAVMVGQRVRWRLAEDSKQVRQERGRRERDAAYQPCTACMVKGCSLCDHTGFSAVSSRNHPCGVQLPPAELAAVINRHIVELTALIIANTPNDLAKLGIKLVPAMLADVAAFTDAECTIRLAVCAAVTEQVANPITPSAIEVVRLLERDQS